MTLIRQSSPHTLGQNNTSRMMGLVLVALAPAIATHVWFFGLGVIIQLLWCSLVALVTESVVLTLRKRQLCWYAKDNSILVTAWLLALAIPTGLPWWITVAGIGFAIVCGKHLYGGIGQNLLNPAMLGFVFLQFVFPQEMNSWLTPHGAGQPTPGLSEILGLILGENSVDGWAMATALTLLQDNNTLTMAELWESHSRLDGVTSLDILSINLAFLIGGLLMLQRRLFTWHAPAAMLGSLLLVSLVFWNGAGPDSNGSPLFHLFSGATMMGAFFIVTDPVSGATSDKGRLLFGAGVGVITYALRTWSDCPDGVALAILLMNILTPAIDYWTRPRTYGHRKPNRDAAELT